MTTTAHRLPLLTAEDAEHAQHPAQEVTAQRVAEDRRRDQERHEAVRQTRRSRWVALAKAATVLGTLATLTSLSGG